MSAIMFAAKMMEKRRRYRERILCRKARRPCLPFLGGRVNFSKESLSEEDPMLVLEDVGITLCVACFSGSMTTGAGIDRIDIAVGVVVVVPMDASRARLSILPFVVNGSSSR